MTAILECQGLGVRRDGRSVLTVDSLVVEEGETLALIGPNGAGKSTLLMLLAGLLNDYVGEFRFRGQVIGPKVNLAYRRLIGLVLQEPLLLDVSVKENVATGLRFRRLPRDEIERRVDKWLADFEIAHLRDRPARRLSGGEAQRVSLARAFALQPDVLLLDEPFSALDAPTRARLLEDLQTLLRQTHTTTILVTHDLDEALLLADQVAVLLDGHLRQLGTPEAVFAAPSDPDVAAFVGVETIVAGVVTQAVDGQMQVTVEGNHLQAVGNLPVGRTVYCCLRPEDVCLVLGEPAGNRLNCLAGHIVRITPQGPLVRIVVDCGFSVVALTLRSAAHQMGLHKGVSVAVTFDASKVHLIVH